MAKLIKPKTQPPVFDYRDYKASDKAYTEWLTNLKRAYKQARPDDDLAGEEVRFQVADNYARYVVVSSSPLTLVHLTYGDGYTYQYITRLRLSDIAQLVQRERAFAKLFERR